MLVGLIGHPVAHSLSAIMHNAAFHALRMPDWRYELWGTPLADVNSPPAMSSPLKVVKARTEF